MSNGSALRLFMLLWIVLVVLGAALTAISVSACLLIGLVSKKLIIDVPFVCLSVVHVFSVVIVVLSWDHVLVCSYKECHTNNKSLLRFLKMEPAYLSA